MKPARIIVLIIAVVAGGIAALLAGRSDPPPPAPAPVVQLETTDVLIANTDIGLGTAVSGATCAGKAGRPRPQGRISFARTTGPMPSMSLLAQSRAFRFLLASPSAKPS